MRLMTAVATLIAESIGVRDYREVSAKLGEMVTYTEMWRHAMDGVESNAYVTEGGLMTLGPLTGMNIYFAPDLGQDGATAAGDCGLRPDHATQRKRPRQP